MTRASHGHNVAPERPSAPPGGLSLRLLLSIAAALLVFGVLCAVTGMFVVSHLNRLERLEQGARQATGYPASAPYPAAPPTPAYAAPYPAGYPAPAAAMPPVYFINGAAYPGGGGAPAGYPGYPVAAQPYAAAGTEMEQFLARKYQAEFDQYLRERSSLQPPSEIHFAYRGDPGHHRSDRIETYSDRRAILVPAQFAQAAKKRYARNDPVETWLREETRASLEYAADDAFDGREPSLDDILRRLAESTYADKQYQRTARIYAELAGRGAMLSVNELMTWAKAAELGGDPAAALRILGLVLKNDPTNQDVLREAANVAVASKKFADAAEYYRRLLEIDPDEREWRVLRAKTLTWAGRGEQALDLMRRLHLENPADEELNVMLADLLLSLSHYEESLPLLDALIASAPRDESLKTRRLDVLMVLKRYDEAADYAAKLLEADPGNEKLLLKLADSRMAAGRYAAAVEPFETYLVLKPGDSDVRYRLANSYMAAGGAMLGETAKSDDAAKAVEQAVVRAAARAGQTPSGAVRKDKTAPGALRYFRLAADEFGTLVAEQPGNLDLRAEYARALMASEQFRKGADVFSTLAEARPHDPRIAFGHVVCLRMAGDASEAMEMARHYLEVQPDNRELLLQAAEIAGLDGDISRAIAWYRYALKIDPKDVDSRIALADTLLWGRHYPMAESEYRKALVYSPHHLKAQRGLARAVYFQRRFQEAYGLYAELMDGGPLSEAVESECAYYYAIAVGMEAEASNRLIMLQELEPDEVLWYADRVQSLLRQHRFGEAEYEAGEVFELDPDHRATGAGMYNKDRYLESIPAQLRAGMVRKTSSPSDNESEDRKAKITHQWVGAHLEGSLGYNIRLSGDLDLEWFKLRTDGVKDARAMKAQVGLAYEGHPYLGLEGTLGYRWFRKPDYLENQWLYDARAELREIAGMPLTVGAFSRRQEFYDNWMNVYDDLYAVDFGFDALYRMPRWDLFGVAQGTVLTDSNRRLDLLGSAMYRLVLDSDLTVRVGGNLEALWWEWERPEYFSPDSYYKAALVVDGRYYICRDDEVWGGPETYLDFGLSLSLDRFDSFGQKLFLGVRHDWNECFSLFGRMEYTHESYYREMRLLGGLEYKFF